MKDFDLIGELEAYVKREIVKNFTDSVDEFIQGFSEQDAYDAVQVSIKLIEDEVLNTWNRHAHSEDLEEFLDLVNNDLVAQFKALATRAIN